MLAKPCVRPCSFLSKVMNSLCLDNLLERRILSHSSSDLPVFSRRPAIMAAFISSGDLAIRLIWCMRLMRLPTAAIWTKAAALTAAWQLEAVDLLAALPGAVAFRWYGRSRAV